MRLTIVLLMFTTAVVPRMALAADGDTAAPEQRMAVFIGVHDWGGLGDLQSVDGGSFQSDGVTIAAAWHRSVAETEWSTLLVGGEVGFFSNDSNIRGSIGELTSRGIYLIPSLKLAFGRQRNFYLDAGAGLYMIYFAESYCFDSGCVEFDQSREKTRFGGYLGFSNDIRFGERWAVVLEAKAHFVDFGEVTGLGLQAQTLSGPIYMLQVGVAF